MDGYFPRFRFQPMWFADCYVDTKLCRFRRIDPQCQPSEWYGLIIWFKIRRLPPNSHTLHWNLVPPLFSQFPKQVKIAAEHVVITSSLGALKASELCFDPPLPESKQMAIQRLGFGTVDKVSLRIGRGFDIWSKWFLDCSNTSWKVRTYPTLIQIDYETSLKNPKDASGFEITVFTAQKMNFPMQDFIRRKLRIWSQLWSNP